MGFDATLGFVVNMGAPASPVAYYQQVGRAGRGLASASDSATVVLLPAIEDRDIWAYFASLAFPREELVRQTIAALAEHGRPMSTAALETHVELNRTRLETMLKVLDVDGAVRRVRGGWEATGQDWVYDEERYRRVAEAREREQAAMLDYLGHRPLPDAGSCATSSTTRRRPSAAAATTVAGSTSPPACRTRRSRRPRPGSPGPGSWSSRARCGRPHWPTSASS